MKTIITCRYAVSIIQGREGDVIVGFADKDDAESFALAHARLGKVQCYVCKLTTEEAFHNRPIMAVPVKEKTR